MKAEKNPKISNRNNWLFICITSLFAVICAYKIIISPVVIDLTGFDFSDLLSIILALFAIAISLVFYFKATETSNQFYDNSYTFTKDISEILGRIEAGFGERLRHLDEGYTGIKERVDRIPVDPVKAEKAIKKEEADIKKWEKERKDLLEQLANRAKLEDDEKAQLFQKLNQQEGDLASAKEELSFFKRRLSRAERRTHDNQINLPMILSDYIRGHIIPELGGPAVGLLDGSTLAKRFDGIQDSLDEMFLINMQSYGLVNVDGTLSKLGIKTIRLVAYETEKKRMINKSG